MMTGSLNDLNGYFQHCEGSGFCFLFLFFPYLLIMKILFPEH